MIHPDGRRERSPVVGRNVIVDATELEDHLKSIRRMRGFQSIKVFHIGAPLSDGEIRKVVDDATPLEVST